MNIAKTWILLAALVAPVCFAQQCPFKDAKGKSVCGVGEACKTPVAVAAVEATISTDALAALIRSGVKMTILDARTGKYDDGRRIPGGRSLAAGAADATITGTAGAKSGLVVTYCSNLKCPASKALAERLRKLGYTNVLEYPDGIAGWAKAGKTVVPAK